MFVCVKEWRGEGCGEGLLVASLELAAVVHEALVKVEGSGLLQPVVGSAGQLEVMTIVELTRVMIAVVGEALARGN